MRIFSKSEVRRLTMKNNNYTTKIQRHLCLFIQMENLLASMKILGQYFVPINCAINLRMSFITS